MLVMTFGVVGARGRGVMAGWVQNLRVPSH